MIRATALMKGPVTATARRAAVLDAIATPSGTAASTGPMTAPTAAGRRGLTQLPRMSPPPSPPPSPTSRENEAEGAALSPAARGGGLATVPCSRAGGRRRQHRRQLLDVVGRRRCHPLGGLAAQPALPPWRQSTLLTPASRHRVRPFTPVTVHPCSGPFPA